MIDPTPVDTPYGTLYVDPEELVIGRLLQADGQIPDISEEVAFFRKYLKPGDTAIDVGANYGLFTLALAQIVGKDGKIFAFEPNPDLLPYFYKTIEGCDAKQWAAVHHAVGRASGVGVLRLDERGSGGTQVITASPTGGLRYFSAIEIVSLDEDIREFNRPIKAIKIDAEGMDVDVLLGAEKILREDRPAVIFEWNPEAMKTLGKDPLTEMANLIYLSVRASYDVTDLHGELWPDPLLGNLAFVPEV